MNPTSFELRNRIMRKTVGKIFLIIIAGLLIASCQQQKEYPVVSSALHLIPSPAAAGSGEPNFFVTENGRLFMNWLESREHNEAALYWSEWRSNQWSEPRQIAAGRNWLVNWADFPAVVSDGGSHMAAFWLVRSGEKGYAYDTYFVQSSNGGLTWSTPLMPHRDGTKSEHGFVSLLPEEAGGWLLIWLDGRKYAQAENGEAGGESPQGEMTLRAAGIDFQGNLFGEQVLDERTCDCCQTSIAKTAHGAVAVYRDRSPSEIRDISLVRYMNNSWEEARPMYADNWEIPGCPVNGPAIDARGEHLVVAWFTGAENTSHIKAIFSDDEGETFGAPIIVDNGRPVGRVDAVLLNDSTAIVSWVERNDTGADIRIRKVNSDGTQEDAIVLTMTSPERASGFPRMVLLGDRLFFAWTLPGEPSRIKTGLVNISDI